MTGRISTVTTTGGFGIPAASEPQSSAIIAGGAPPPALPTSVSPNHGVALQNATTRFGEAPITAHLSAETLRRNVAEYVREIPHNVGGNLRQNFPGLWRALRGEEDLNKRYWRVQLGCREQAMHRNVFYFGDRQAARVIVSLTGAPITAGYLVPFFKRLEAELNDPGTAFLLLPSCATKEAKIVLYHLARLNRRLESVDFFTHSGGSLTLHQIQKDGYLPEISRTFCALGWVHRYDFQTLSPTDYVPEPVENFRLHKKQYGAEWNWNVKRGLCMIGRYYFPKVLWNDPETREVLIRDFIDPTRLRRVTEGLSELQAWQSQRGSYARQITQLAHRPGMRFLIFAGTKDDAVSERHSREALARLSGVPLSAIPQNEPWRRGNLNWHPLVGAKHLPMFERRDEMVQAYAAFLKK